MRQPEAYVDIDDVVTRFRGSGGLKHRFQAYKLFELNQLLERHRPATILELGSGSSTAIFAAFVKQGEGRHLTSVDESGKWLANARSLAGINADDARFTWLESQPRAHQDASGVRIGYGISAAPYDFVFIDGPSLKLDGVQQRMRSTTMSSGCWATILHRLLSSTRAMRPRRRLPRRPAGNTNSCHRTCCPVFRVMAIGIFQSLSGAKPPV